MSNYATPPQLVEDVPYRDLDEMHAFARRWRDEHRGQWFTVPKLSGFCLLMTRAVYEPIGGLDERFGLGFFDDDDLAERARRAGFELAVAHDLFVHHFGSRTFVGNGIDAEAAAGGERAAVRRQVGARTRRAAGGSRCEPGGSRAGVRRDRGDRGCRRPQRRIDEPLRVRSRDSALSAIRGICVSAEPRRTARVSLTMIVRDEEKNLPHCLESVRGIFDEIVVVDTGSIDRTSEIARAFGARVFDFAWVDDFAAARNAALAHATGDYAFWLDADDVVEPPEREKLRALLDGLRAGDDGRLRRAMRLRPRRGRQRRRDRRRSHPAVPAPRRRPLDLSRPRADPARPAAGRHPRALDRPGRAAHRLCRPRPAGPEARARQPDPPRGAGGPAR